MVSIRAGRMRLLAACPTLGGVTPGPSRLISPHQGIGSAYRRVHFGVTFDRVDLSAGTAPILLMNEGHTSVRTTSDPVVFAAQCSRRQYHDLYLLPGHALHTRVSVNAY